MRDARLVEALGDQERRNAGARAPLIRSLGFGTMTVERRRRNVVPLPAELVIGDDDQRVLAIRPLDDRLDEIDEMLAAFGLAGVARMLVLLADRLDEADLLQPTGPGRLDELSLGPSGDPCEPAFRERSWRSS
ncbi:hypothetical protein ABIF23_005766 [Bradyrhizobium elkanii]